MLPLGLRHVLKVVLYSFYLLPDYWYWFKRDLLQSDLFSNEKSDLSGLMVISHVLEKGITMPGRKMGFGYDRVREIIRRCHHAISKYSEKHVEIQSTLKDLEQYQQIHDSAGFELPADIKEGISSLLTYKITDTVSCFESTPQELFKATKDFSEFAHSRHTVRWYSEEHVDKALLIKAVELAMTAPSACNRQSTRVYIIDTKEKIASALHLQNGNRGFGHLADKLLLITSDMKYWSFKMRNSAFLDAGIFSMNLLYALHHYEIAACTLNAHLTIKKRKELQMLVGYSESEMPMVFIAIGKAPERFMVAGSQRLDTDQIYRFV